MKKIEEKVINFISQYKLIDKGDHILVAFSGGPDSVFALYFLQKYQKKYNIKLSAMHLNHLLRGNESDQEEIFASNFCRERNINFYSYKIDVKKKSKSEKISIEEAARKLRYDRLTKMAEQLKCNKIVTAHNLTDNTETVLLNLFSGTGSSGLSGIPIQRKNIVRPFLCLAKEKIIKYLEKSGTKFKVDSSNLSDDFKRNYIRNQILPLIRMKINPAVDEAIFRSMKNQNEKVNLKAFGYLIDKFIKKHDSKFVIDLRLADLFDGEIPGEILKVIFRDKFNLEFQHDDYVKLNSLIKKQKGKIVNLKGNITALREDDSILIEHKIESDQVDKKLKVGHQLQIGDKTIGIEKVSPVVNFKKKISGEEFISADKLSPNFHLRNWLPGDSFYPIGMKSKKKVSDFLTDLKLPSSTRKNHLVLLNRNHIVWVVGLRISDKVKITNKTKRVYKLWVN